jgi:Uma2 family endonuclease
MKEKSVKEPEVSYDKHYTYRDYLQFTFDEMVEIIKGKLFKMSPGPNTAHQAISRNLSGCLFNHLKGKNCQFFSAPFDVILPVKDKDFLESDRVVQPDIVVICDSAKIQERGCFGAPDWIIEILSPNTTRKDLQDKFDLYEESKVGEYWIVEPRNQTVEVFVLENNIYKRITTYVREDQVTSHTLPELTIELGDVFEKYP